MVMQGGLGDGFCLFNRENRGLVFVFNSKWVWFVLNMQGRLSV